MGSVIAYETAAGKRYRVRYRRPDHTETQKRGFKTKKEAELYLAEVDITKATGQYIDPAAALATIGSLGSVWLQNQTHLKPSSLRPVQIAWRVHVEPEWAKHPVGKVRHSDIQRWVSQLSLNRSATTVLRAYGVLTSILESAVRDRLIPANPSKNVNLPRKTKKEHAYLSDLEIERLADNSGAHALLIYVLAYTGLRWGEAAGLRTRDIDMLKRRINVTVNAVEVGGQIEVGSPKSHKRRSVPFPAFIEPLLGAAINNKSGDDLVFSDRSGQHMRRTRVSSGSRSWFKSALVQAELEPMTLHDLRHTAASLAISSGANVKAVQRMLGHASAAMTLDIYADLFDDDVDRVAQAMNDKRDAAIEAKMRPNNERTKSERSAIPVFIGE